MPLKKKDALRALRLLEEYRAKLGQTEDVRLRQSIQRVINVFQSDLFLALIDIQESYEVTLLENQTCGDPSQEPEPGAIQVDLTAPSLDSLYSKLQPIAPKEEPVAPAASVDIVDGRTSSLPRTTVTSDSVCGSHAPNIEVSHTTHVFCPTALLDPRG